MEQRNYIRDMIQKFVVDLSKPALFIKHYNKHELTKTDFLPLISAASPATCLYHEYESSQMCQAFEPFLDWIRRFYYDFYKDTHSPEDFLKECAVYSLHIEPLASYITTGICVRTEDVMYQEIGFEKSCFQTDIINILEHVASNHPLVLLLNSFHLAPLSSIQILLSILKKQIPSVHFIVVFNDSYYQKKYLLKAWHELLEFMKDFSMLYEWGQFTTDVTMTSTDEFVFQTTDAQQNITKLTNMIQCIVMEDAKYYISDIYSKLEHNLSLLPSEDCFKILSLYVHLSLAMEDTDRAIMACKLITNLDTFQTDPLVEYQYHYLSIYTQMSSGHMDIINNSYQHCVSIAADLQDDFLLFKANLLFCMAQFGGWKDLFLCDFRIPIQTELLEQCMKYHFLNHLAYLYTMGFENDEESITKIATGQENSYYFTKGVQIAKSLGNNDFLMSAYMKNIIVYSDAGYHEYVYQMHKKRIETVNSDDKTLQAHMFLGIGYNCIILENYTKADQYFREALHNLADEGKADDTMDALYNICMNYFVIEDYETVIPCVETLLKMLSALGYQNIMVCNTAKLYAMLAVSYFHLGDYYNTHHYLGMMDVYMNQFTHSKDNTEYRYWEEELFLYHYIRAILYQQEGNLEACQKSLDVSYKFLWLLPGTIFYTYSLYTITQASVYETLGETEKRQQLFDKAITYYKKHGFIQCAEKLTALAAGVTPRRVVVPFNEPDLWFDKLLNLANYAGTQNKLKYREKDIAFLTIWQDNLNRSDNNISRLLENAVNIMQNSYNLCDVMILRHRDDNYTTLYNNSDITLSDEKMQDIFSFFEQYKRGILTNRTDKNFNQFMPIIEPFDINRIVTMLGIPISDGKTQYVMLSHVNAQRNFTGNRVLLTDENLVTLKFAYSQLIDAIRQITANQLIREMNEELEKVSMTDYLTGLYNRHGLSFILKNELAQYKDSPILVLYIDLDNFKYYNDTFGHDVGDFVLVHFTKIFTSLIGEDGFAIRYGGDEFVMVLPNKTEFQGQEIAREIYKKIGDGCLDALEGRIGHPISVPDNQKLSCSIGITQYTGSTRDDLEKALNNADQALYFIKRNSKGHAMTWTKLQDFQIT